jgi:hypothetical protein
MRYLRICLTLGMLASLSAKTYGQAWSGILSRSRAADWSSANPGVVGGVPSASWTQCGSTISAYGSSSAPASPATINNAIAGCGANTFVLLGAGTFYLNSGIVMKSNVVLRGMGADRTSIIFSGNNSCGGWYGAICFAPSTYYYFGSPAAQPGGSNAGSWTSGYAQGSTTITLSNLGSAALTNGQYLFLDQANDASDNKSFFVCDNTSAPCSLEGGSPGRNIGGVDRNQIQIVKVVSGCASGCSGSGPFTITITPGIYAANYRSSQSPGAWWISFLQNAGVENLSVDLSASGGYSGFVFTDAANCWVSGVRSLKANRNHVWLMQAAHVTVQNSYFFGTQNSAAQSYGVESYIASDNLVVNNIFQQVTSPIMMGPSQGSAFAFNYTNNNSYYSATWMMPSIMGGHDAGGIYNLYEGNVGTSWLADVFHGTSGLNTIFRNRFAGWDFNRLTNTVPIVLFSYNRYNNFIGNVLGQPGYHSLYQTSLGTGATTSIFDFGSGNAEGSVAIHGDPLVASTALRWGNYDTVTSTVRWCGDSSSLGWSTTCASVSEIPSKLTDIYANPVPGSTNLPPSLLYPSIPKWWPAGKPWPLIGPDVSSGNITGLAGHANTNPAQDCYANVMAGPSDGAGIPLTFNASACYAGGSTSGSTTQPAPPTNLIATPQ